MQAKARSAMQTKAIGAQAKARAVQTEARGAKAKASSRGEARVYVVLLFNHNYVKNWTYYKVLCQIRPIKQGSYTARLGTTEWRNQQWLSELQLDKQFQPPDSVRYVVNLMIRMMMGLYHMKERISDITPQKHKTKTRNVKA